MAALVVAAALALSPLACGDVHPQPKGDQARLDFSVRDVDGKVVKLADFKGRPMLINFWATWCGPCKVEIPMFNEFMETYKDKKFIVLGVSTTDTVEELRPFMAEWKMNYPVLLGRENDALVDAYQAALQIPVSWFIRADGTVALRHDGLQSKEWFDEQIRALF